MHFEVGKNRLVVPGAKWVHMRFFTAASILGKMRWSRAPANTRDPSRYSFLRFPSRLQPGHAPAIDSLWRDVLFRIEGNSQN